ncbi:hypothetical protein IWQ61_006216 [Dispira simplex]|nr:hypothetical protein IWQ61_006216 [Dispira simplex]
MPIVEVDPGHPLVHSLDPNASSLESTAAQDTNTSDDNFQRRVHNDYLLRWLRPFESNPHSANPLLLRGGLTPTQKISTVLGVGGLWGFVIGAYLGGRKASLQYLAEHLHKLPRTREGWYFYHKHKNYRVMLNGIYSGSSYAAKFVAICGAFTLTESVFDLWKGDTDASSTLIAAFVTASTFAYLNQLPRYSFRYAMRVGTITGLAIGLGQDVLHYYQGQPPFYFQWFRRTKPTNSSA